MAHTLLSNLLNPQVIGALVEKKLIDKIKFAPLCEMNTDLQGRSGNTVTFPTWNYIGEAADVAEGVAANIDNITMGTSEVTVKKIVKVVGVTDEAVLSGHGDVRGQIVSQLTTSIADKIEKDVIAEARKATFAVTAQPKTKEAILNAQELFGEDLEGEMVYLVHPTHRTALLKDVDFVAVANGEKILSGEIGTIYGVRVVISNRVAEDEAFLVKQGALGIALKRGLAMEGDRDVLKKQSILSADQHYTAYLRDASKIVKVAFVAAMARKK